MMHQLDLFGSGPRPVVPPPASGETRKLRGIGRVTDHNGEWLGNVLALVARLAILQGRDGFTVEDVRALAERRGLPEPDHPNAWGAAMHVARRRGLIREAGYRKATRADAHARVIRAWEAA